MQPERQSVLSSVLVTYYHLKNLHLWLDNDSYGVGKSTIRSGTSQDLYIWDQAMIYEGIRLTEVGIGEHHCFETNVLHSNNVQLVRQAHICDSIIVPRLALAHCIVSYSDISNTHTCTHTHIHTHLLYQTCRTILFRRKTENGTFLDGAKHAMNIFFMEKKLGNVSNLLVHINVAYLFLYCRNLSGPFRAL